MKKQTHPIAILQQKLFFFFTNANPSLKRQNTKPRLL